MFEIGDRIAWDDGDTYGAGTILRIEERPVFSGHCETYYHIRPDGLLYSPLWVTNEDLYLSSSLEAQN